MLNYKYRSEFKVELMKLIEYKHSQNLKYKQESRCRQLDIFLLKNFPNQKKIDIELVNKWFARKINENVRNWYERMAFLRMFALFIKEDLKKEKYVEKEAIIKMNVALVSLRKIFSKSEMKRILEIADTGRFETTAIKHKEQISLTLGLIIRTIFCCGLKIEEVINLDVEDVDLEHGIISIYDENNIYRCRQVPVNEELTKMLKDYSIKCHKKSINIDPFFYNLGNYARIQIKKEKEYFESVLLNACVPYERTKKMLNEPLKN